VSSSFRTMSPAFTFVAVLDGYLGDDAAGGCCSLLDVALHHHQAARRSRRPQWRGGSPRRSSGQHAMRQRRTAAAGPAPLQPAPELPGEPEKPKMRPLRRSRRPPQRRTRPVSGPVSAAASPVIWACASAGVRPAGCPRFWPRFRLSSSSVLILLGPPGCPRCDPAPAQAAAPARRQRRSLASARLRNLGRNRPVGVLQAWRMPRASPKA